MTTPAAKIPNRFGKSCHYCTNWVNEGAGFAIKVTKDSPWVTQCRACNSGDTPEPEVNTPSIKRPTFPLTSEQTEAVALFEAGESIAIQAGAGTGKTSTLVAIAKSTSRIGAYVAFNKAIVKDAAIKLAGTNCSAATAHSLAFRQVGKLYSKRLNAPRQTSRDIARRLGLEPFYCQVGDAQKVLQPATLAGYVVKAISAFCNSEYGKPSAKFVPYIDGIDLPGDDGRRTYANNELVKEYLKDAIKAAWKDICDVDGGLRFTHDHYLKIWELGIHGEPVINGDYILFDEAQDASPVLVSVVEQQGKQVVYVGDAQQAIYEWRGAVDALDNVSTESTCYLTNSFRFGPSIADVANKVLSQIPTAKLRLTGLGGAGAVEHVADPDAVLTRTNAGAIGVVLEALAADKTVHLVGGGGEVERFAKAARELQQTGKTDHPELLIFESWTEVQDYVASDPQGSELALLVKLIDQNGVDAVLRAVANTVSEEEADLVVTTAHKSKGREWDAVRIYSDFPPNTESDSDNRLLYVAVTRARKVLDITSCAPAVAIVSGFKAPLTGVLDPSFADDTDGRYEEGK